ncbi:MAG TPA: vWA domain-containing protein [Gemmataceae bacterium]|nr:vWA domain-containing protein [Gemmataceae bacterium]
MSRSFTTARALAVLGAVLALLAVSPSARAADKKAANIDVVICLDVSNSMDGLIASAKAKLWDIVNDLGKVKPSPNLRVGLYSYGHNNYPRDRGWVRKELDLTTDLDSVYQKLNGLTTYGGDEYVARVCRDAISEQKWSEDKKSLKMIFVCGNEPANQDPQVHLKDVAQMALKKDIVINTIYCGPATHPEAKGWREFAVMAEGRFASIDQEGGTVAIATPQDKKLAELSGKLNTTYVAYGKEQMRREKAVNQATQDANAAKLPGAAAARATSKGGALYRNSDWDLVDRLIDDPKFDITKVPEKELCDELRKLKPEERVKYVKDQLEKRRGIQKEIMQLSKERDEYLKKESKKNAKKGDKAFDEAVRGTLREQAARKGLTIPE